MQGFPWIYRIFGIFYGHLKNSWATVYKNEKPASISKKSRLANNNERDTRGLKIWLSLAKGLSKEDFCLFLCVALTEVGYYFCKLKKNIKDTLNILFNHYQPTRNFNEISMSSFSKVT